ncbi:hypothetical protein MTR_2g073530 [Medicago truncatula]|uniref:Myb-like domain-containing protein n=1 Tax=Medicago truncatula TaxID=3880 RepID=A0A072V938_MEDTR|nr:hypothetical protein MTR_2g073530 [Medicago truncatula]
MMRYPSQTPPFNGYMPMENENFPIIGASQFPEFPTHITPGGMAVANEVTPNPEDSTPKSNKSKEPTWNTEQHLVLISAWIKFGTNNVVGRIQRGETYWGKIDEYCIEYGSFDSPRDLVACQNRFNYMSKVINKWISAYDAAKRLQGSGKKKIKNAALEEVEKKWVEFKEIKVQEIEQLKEFTAVQHEKYRLKKMKLYVMLSSGEHLDDRKKEMLENLERELFEN